MKPVAWIRTKHSDNSQTLSFIPSVAPHEAEPLFTADQLRQVEQQVTVTYKEVWKASFAQGETDYFATGVRRR